MKSTYTICKTATGGTLSSWLKALQFGLSKAKTKAKEITGLPTLMRYDANEGLWAICEENTGKPVRHISFGILHNVRFSVRTTTETVSLGCGSEKRTGKNGFATGILEEDATGFDMKGWKNLSFDGNAFIDVNGKTLPSCNQLRLMPGRRALYK